MSAIKDWYMAIEEIAKDEISNLVNDNGALLVRHSTVDGVLMIPAHLEEQLDDNCTIISDDDLDDYSTMQVILDSDRENGEPPLYIEQDQETGQWTVKGIIGLPVLLPLERTNAA